MNEPHPEKLLKDILAGEELSDFRTTSLEYGLTSLRLRRRRRRLLNISLIATLPLAVLAMLFFGQTFERAFHPPKSLASSPNKLAPRLTIINDEQLLALFPDQPVALVGKPGQQQLVLLNEFKSDLKQ